MTYSIDNQYTLGIYHDHPPPHHHQNPHSKHHHQVNGFPLPLVALLPLYLQHPPHPQQHGRVTGRTGGSHDDDGGDGDNGDVDDYHGEDN